MGFVVGVAAVYLIFLLLKEALERPAPKGRYFDWDAYWYDVDRGITAKEQVKKCERGSYYKIKEDE